MKTSLLKYVLIVLAYCLKSQYTLAQEYYDGTNSPRQYYYNNMESVTAGTYSTYFANCTTFQSTTASVTAATSTMTNGLTKSLTTVGSNTLGYIGWNFLANSATGSNTDLNSTAWEWEFDYKNVTGATTTDPGNNAVNGLMTAGTNSWRYWLIAPTYATNNTTYGIYITQAAGNLILRYKYGSASNQYTDYATIAMANNTDTYQVRIERSIIGYYNIYILDRNTGVTSSNININVGTGAGSNYNFSYLEATSTTAGRFQWDNFNFYQVKLEYSPISTSPAGISNPIYPGMGNAIPYAVNVNVRGDVSIGRFVIAYTGDIGKLYSAATLYKEAINTTLAVGSGTSLGSYSLNSTETSQLDLSSIPEKYYSGGNTDGTTVNVINYFLYTTVRSPFSSGYPTSVTYSVSNTANNNYNQYYTASAPLYSASSPSSSGPASANGNAYDWNGGTTAWGTSGNWTPLGSAPAGVPGASDIARIAVNTGITWTNQPTISSATPVGTIILGTKASSGSAYPILTVNATLTVSGGISQNSNWTQAVGTNNQIIGTGAITAASLTVGDGSATANTSGSSGLVLGTSNTITLTGDLSLISSAYVAGFGPGALSINSGCTVSCARVVTSNPSSTNCRTALFNGGTLNLTGATPFSISSLGVSYFSFGGTVNYSGATQSIFINLTQAGGTGHYTNLTLSGTGTKSVNTTGTLYIDGNLTTANTPTIDFLTNTPTVNFSGNAQTITNANAAVPITFANLTFGNTTTTNYTKTISGAGSFALVGTGILTISNSSTGTTTVATGGLLTLNSTATSTASVAAIPSGSSITGNVIVQRYFSGGPVATQRAYRLISSPVNSNTVTNDATSSAYFNPASLSNLYTGGPGGSTNGFTVANSGTSTVFVYREDTPPINTSFNYGNYKGIANMTTPFPVSSISGTYSLYAGNGLMIYYVGSVSSNVSYNVKSGTYPNPDNAIATFTGTLNQGDIPVKLWYGTTAFTYTGTTTATGFALVGNPYAATIDLTKFTQGGTDPGTGFYGNASVSKSFYIYDYSAKQFYAYLVGTGSQGGNASQYIASGQGFFAKTTAAGGTLTFHEGAKNTAGQPSGSTLLLGTPVTAEPRQFLHLKVAQDAINHNEVLVVFDPAAKNTYEPEIDIDYVAGIGSTIAIGTYAKGSGQTLAINQMHGIDSLTRIKINIGSTFTGTDTLSGIGFDKLDQRYDAYLVDHYKKDSTLFSNTTSYLFNINLNDTLTFGSTRFELVFHKKAALTNYKLLSFTASKITSGINLVNNGILLTWKTQNEGNYTGFTVQRAGGSLQFLSLYSLQSDGNGTYTYTDRAPLAGVNKYRMMQNGAFDDISYSETVTIDPTLAGALVDPITLYPNPVVNQLQISIGNNPPSQVHLTIMNTGSGMVMMSMDISSSNIQQNVGSLSTGSYIVEVSDVTTKRIIGLKKFIKL